jgi:hypothetical protein
LGRFVRHSGSSRVRSGDVDQFQVGRMGVHGQFQAWLNMPRARGCFEGKMASIGVPMAVNIRLEVWL